MTKCSICNSRKGKRKCLDQDRFICALCCGRRRSFENCDGCSFYRERESIRNYKRAPYYPLSLMSNKITLQDQAYVIESAISQLAEDQGRILDDSIVMRLVELLLDRYYFNNDPLTFSNDLERKGFISIDHAIRDGLASLSPEKICTLLGTIYRSIIRHKDESDRRAYIDFVKKHVGLRIEKGYPLTRSFR